MLNQLHLARFVGNYDSHLADKARANYNFVTIYVNLMIPTIRKIRSAADTLEEVLGC